MVFDDVVGEFFQQLFTGEFVQMPVNIQVHDLVERAVEIVGGLHEIRDFLLRRAARFGIFRFNRRTGFRFVGGIAFGCFCVFRITCLVGFGRRVAVGNGLYVSGVFRCHALFGHFGGNAGKSGENS